MRKDGEWVGAYDFGSGELAWVTRRSLGAAAQSVLVPGVRGSGWMACAYARAV